MSTLRQLRVLTFNTWGLPLASKDDKLRLGKQAEYFRQSGKDLDVALLQEVWTDAYVALLSGAAAEAGLAYCTTFDGGVLGAGLIVLSRFPILDVAFRMYSVRGEPGALQGEALSGKGIGYARVLLPWGGSAHLFNTHTHANWVHSVVPDEQFPDVKVPTDTFAPYRTAHVLEAIGFMRPIVEAAAAVGEPIVAGGDWNVPVDNLEACLLRELLPSLEDAWQAAGREPLDPAGNTCGDPGNVYTGSIIGGYVPERIDFIWTNCRVTSCQTVLKVMPGTRLNYSDHYAVQATVQCDPGKRAVATAAAAALPSCRVTVKATAVAAAESCSEADEDAATFTASQHGEAGTAEPPAVFVGGPPQQLQQPSLRRRQPGFMSPGPVAEAKVSPAPQDGAVTGAGKPSRRQKLLTLALGQLRCGMAMCMVGQARLKRIALAWAAVAAVLLAVELYGIMATTDHWAKRLGAGVAAVTMPAAVGLSLYQVPLMCMNAAGRRSFGQLVRMVEVWQAAAEAASSPEM